MMQWLSKMSNRTLVFLGLFFGGVTLLAVNMISWETLRLYQFDATQNRLFTLTDSTKKVIDGVKDPITIKLYYNDLLGDRAPVYGLYAQRIEALLQHYATLSGGLITFEKISPEPFSDEEDRAVAAGMTALRLGGGQKGYLGIAASNSTDDEEVIPFMSLDRASFLEYDLTKMVLKLSSPAKKPVGLITGLDMRGAVGPQGQPVPAWLVMKKLEEFFNIRNVDLKSGRLPDGLDALILTAPPKLSDKMAEAIEQFALSGKPVLVFADPFTETKPRLPDGLKRNGQNLVRLLKAWGVSIDPDKVVGDGVHPRRIQFNSATQPVIVDYLVWLTLGKESFDVKSPILANVERLQMATVGALSAIKGAGTKFSPLVTSSGKSMLYPLSDIAPPDPVKLINRFLPDGKPKVLAARVSGKAKAVFGNNKQSSPGRKSSGAINVVVVADSDFLYDTFWARGQRSGTTSIIVPVANNPDLVLNALEVLSGGAALAGLRGRGVENRPFTKVEEIRRRAEARYRKRELVLNNKLKAAQKKLSEIQSKGQKGEVFLSDDDRQAILGFRREVVALRQDLRNVQRALNRDIDRLQFWVQFVNTAGVPLLIGLGGLVFAGWRRQRRKKQGDAK